MEETKVIECIEENQWDAIDALLEEFSKLIGAFCPDEIPDLGAMLVVSDKLLDIAKTISSDDFSEVVTACRTYVENMTLENMYNTRPIESGVLLLKALVRHLKRDAPFIFDISDVLELLNCFKDDFENDTDSNNGMAPDQDPDTESVAPENLSDDDMEILIDFVSEAQENLDSIEVSLIELEQDPTDKEIINNIFRPFHTIKGVSGFLSLKKINLLAHATENLLDGARNGDFLINHLATDTILESVDTLKLLIERTRDGVAKGKTVQDEDIDIEDLRNRIQNLQTMLSKSDAEPLGQILVKKGALDDAGLEQALEFQKEHPDQKIGEILVEKKTVPRGQVESALMEQKRTKFQASDQVKVSTQKLDDLVDYAGELVIAQSMLRQQASKDAAIFQGITQMGQIVTHIQNIAMSMRMIPIKATFMKMIRLVRDLSQKSGKDVALTMSGEDTEIDRNVVDALYEPMVHMIRNSVDHGIESVDIRKKFNKPEQGSIHLRAFHKGGHIIIEIEDDGKGLDRVKILEKAISTGLIKKDAGLTDSQVFDLILQPGFSTAQEITDVSGRGVGMDVVKQGIEKFRGHLNIQSAKGRGTKFTISLPLTLAIIDGMLVRSGEERYVIPTTAISRAFKPEKKNCFTVEGKVEMLKSRDTLIPLIRLKQIYGGKRDPTPAWEALVVVVESKDEQRALLIDELLGKDEYVIKSLGSGFEEVKGITGGAILGDGKVGLILDIHGIFSLADSD